LTVESEFLTTARFHFVKIYLRLKLNSVCWCYDLGDDSVNLFLAKEL